jgi:hypothetical protein
MNLTEHFTLEEFTASQTAARLGINNTPDPEALANLHNTAAGMELVRTFLGGVPVKISSGYRCLALNAAVGSRTTSQHVTGCACDFTAPEYGTPEHIVRDLMASDVPYDQLIFEFGTWVHISFSPQNRRQALTIDHDGTRAFA